MFRYDPEHYLLFTVDLPVAFEVAEATAADPFLGLKLDLDRAVVASVAMDYGIKFRRGDAGVKAIDVSTVDTELLEVVVRLFRSVESPNDVQVLAPLIIREIIYRLLVGGQGAAPAHDLSRRRYQPDLQSHRTHARAL